MLNDTPHILFRGGYALLEKKMKNYRAQALGLESPTEVPAIPMYEQLKAARTKSDGIMTSQ